MSTSSKGTRTEVVPLSVEQAPFYPTFIPSSYSDNWVHEAAALQTVARCELCGKQSPEQLAGRSYQTRGRSAL